MGLVVIAAAAAAAAGIASMGGADSGVVGTACAADEWVVAAASTLVAGFVVAAAAEVAVRVGVACASREVVELMVAAAGIATDEVDEDCVVVAGSVAVAAGPHRPGSYRLDCCTAGRRAGLAVELAVSQASFGIPRRAVSGWRCRSTVRSVERAGEADGKLVIRANAARGSASVEGAGSHAAAAVVAERVAAVASRGERSR